MVTILLVVDLVGRGGELNALRHALDRAAAGRRSVVAIRGEAGIGKTSLLSELRAEATRRGYTTLTTAVTDIETSIGWSGLATLLWGSEPTIGELIPPQRDALLATIGHGATSQVEPLTVAAALAELLRRQAATGPLVVIIDDVHWLDPATASALSFAIRLHADVAILFVLAARRARIPLDLARLVDPATPDDLVVVDPARLSVGAIHELLRQRFGLQLGRVDLVRLHELTGGNPLHVVETGRLLADGVPLTDALMPASLAGVVDMQLDGIDDAHLPILQAAALMPTIDVAQLVQLYPDADVEAALARAESLDVVRVFGTTLTFRHPLVRAGLARRTNTFERRSLHRRLASLSEEIEVIAFHLAEATDGYDEATAEMLEAAAHAAVARGLPVQAAHHARRAYEVTEPTDVIQRNRRRLLAATTATDGGDPRGALELLLPMVDGHAHEEPDMLRMVALATTAASSVTAGLPWIQRWIDATAPDSDSHVRALMMMSRTMQFHDVSAAGVAAERALTAAAAIGDEALSADARAARDLADHLAGRRIDIDRLVRIPEPRSSPDLNTARSMTGAMLIWCDRLDDAALLLSQELATHEERGSVIGTLDTTSHLIDVSIRSGDLERATTLSNRALALAQAAGLDKRVTLRSGELTLLGAMRGDPYRSIVDVVEQVADPWSRAETAKLHATLGHAALIGGDNVVAVRRLRSAHACAGAMGLVDMGVVPYCGNLVEALVAVGEVDEAAAVATSMASTAANAQRGRGDAEARRAHAMVLAAIGDLAEADVAATDAVSAFEKLPLPIEQGRTLLLSGNIARRRKQRARAGDLLRAADALFVATGALAYSRRVHAELDRLGAPTTNELTATEAQIAELVAAGRRNDEIAAELFVTRRTVESNLTRIYRKLGVRSRTELAARLRAN